MRAPSKTELIEVLTTEIYGGPIINNSHRGDVAEMLVLMALRPDWQFVGLGWHPWDLQRGQGSQRVRIQVKQFAALQVWGATKKPSIQFGWKPNAPAYFERDNPGEHIESKGWFCDIFVVGLHREVDPHVVDQLDARQWSFLVIPVSDLSEGRKSIALHLALERWQPVPWSGLAAAVDQAIAKLSQSTRY